jgi:DNA-binding transcriptional regulator YiaG
MRRRTKKPAGSVGATIVQRLEELVTKLESGEPLEKVCTIRRVALPAAPVPSPSEVKKIREAVGASQAVFAGFLGVSAHTVRAWEQGVNVPSGIACRFLDEIRRDLQHWRRRLEDSLVRISVSGPP